MPATQQHRTAVIVASDAALGERLTQRLAAEAYTTVCFVHPLDEAPSEAAIAAEVDRVEREVGPIEVLIWGGLHPGRATFETLTLETYAAYMRATVESALLYSKACVRYMERRRSGRILLLTSIAANLGDEDILATIASGCLNTFAKSLAREEARRGISVNALSLGLIDDWEASHKTVIRKFYAHYFPYRAVFDLRALADTVASLVTTSNGFVNGQVVRFDGGTL